MTRPRTESDHPATERPETTAPAGETDAPHSIREMCDAFGVTARALRFYEGRGLLSPERDGQHRRYHRRERARLQLILQGKRFGFSLEQIRELLELYDPSTGNRAQIAAALACARERLADMRRQHAELGTAIEELTARIAAVETAQDEAAGPTAATPIDPRTP